MDQLEFVNAFVDLILELCQSKVSIYNLCQLHAHLTRTRESGGSTTSYSNLVSLVYDTICIGSQYRSIQSLTVDPADPQPFGLCGVELSELAQPHVQDRFPKLNLDIDGLYNDAQNQETSDSSDNNTAKNSNPNAKQDYNDLSITHELDVLGCSIDPSFARVTFEACTHQDPSCHSTPAAPNLTPSPSPSPSTSRDFDAALAAAPQQFEIQHRAHVVHQQPGRNQGQPTQSSHFNRPSNNNNSSSSSSNLYSTTTLQALSCSTSQGYQTEEVARFKDYLGRETNFMMRFSNLKKCRRRGRGRSQKKPYDNMLGKFKVLLDTSHVTKQIPSTQRQQQPGQQ